MTPLIAALLLCKTFPVAALLSPWRVTQALFEKPSTLPFYLETSPLIGGPSWLPLHVKVMLKDSTSDQVLVFDFIPVDATEPATLQSLLSLQHVPGQVRYNNKPSSLSSSSTNDPSSTFIQTTSLSAVPLLVITAQEFCNDYPNTRLHLLENNCWTFALALLERLDQAYNTVKRVNDS